jgi:eukaryotic-like serine/threonine-protein kinase
MLLLSFGSGIGIFWLVSFIWFQTPQPPVREFQLQIPGKVPSGRSAVVSPDGSTIAYVSDTRLWLRPLDNTDATPVPGSNGAVLPFWSSDSDSIAFFNSRSGSLQVADMSGEPARIRCNLPARGVYGGGSWTADGTILFSQGPLGLYSLAADSDEPEPLVLAAEGDAGFYAPHVMPDGASVLFSVWKKDGLWQIEMLSDGKRTIVIDASPGEIVTGPVYSPTGHILYNRVHGNGEGIWAVPFAKDERAVEKTAFQVAGRGGWPSIAAGNMLIYTRTEQEIQQQMTWLSRDGKFLGPVGKFQVSIASPAISPDDEHIAVSGLDGGIWDIWTHEVSQGSKTRLTFDESPGTSPAWSSGGDQIAFVTDSGDSSVIQVISTDGSSKMKKILSTAVGDLSPTWSRDGYYMVYEDSGDSTGIPDLWYLALKESGIPVQLTATPHSEAQPQFSPDGRYLAYQSDESGSWEVYVVPFPEGTNPRRVSGRGGIQPRWSYWSEELFYIRGNSMMAAPIRSGRKFRILGPPVRLFRWDFERYGPTERSYDVTSDGQRFLVVGDDVNTVETSIVVVENWSR